MQENGHARPVEIAISEEDLCVFTRDTRDTGTSPVFQALSCPGFVPGRKPTRDKMGLKAVRVRSQAGAVVG